MPQVVLKKLFNHLVALEPMQGRILRAQRSNDISGSNFKELIQAAKVANIISDDELQKLLSLEDAIADVIAVDDFANSELARD